MCVARGFPSLPFQAAVAVPETILTSGSHFERLCSLSRSYRFILGWLEVEIQIVEKKLLDRLAGNIIRLAFAVTEVHSTCSWMAGWRFVLVCNHPIFNKKCWMEEGTCGMCNSWSFENPCVCFRWNLLLIHHYELCCLCNTLNSKLLFCNIFITC